MGNTTAGYPNVPEFFANEQEHRRLLARSCNNLLQGKSNNVTVLTLTANSASTTLTDARIGVNSFLAFMPLTANAATELGNGTLFVSSRTSATGATLGNAVINHANNAQTDRNYSILIIG